MDPNKNLDQISNKELLKDFFQALTDIERKLFRTAKELFISPETVIQGYIGEERDKYFSVFRYLIFVVFLGYISYSIFMKPQEIGGPFYKSLRKGIELGVHAQDKMGKEVVFSVEAFNQFYIEYTKMMTYFFKLSSCFSIPAIFLALMIFFRGLKFNIASRLVTSTFFASQAALISYICLIPLSILVEDVITQSYILYFPILAYLIYCFYRLGKGKLSRIILRSISAALCTNLIFYSLNMAYGITLFSYVKTYTPKFAVKKEKSENTQLQDGKKEIEKSNEQ